MIMFRKATKEDDVAYMLYDSSPDLLNFCLRFNDRSPEDFIKFDFKRGKGIFGYQSMFVAEYEGKIVGTLTAYYGKDYWRLLMATMLSAWSFFGPWHFFKILICSIKLGPYFIQPSRNGVYIANGYVLPTFRIPGVFSALVDCAEKMALEKGYKIIECDVSYKNERSLKVHQFLGFKITYEKPYKGDDPLLDGVRRLQLDLEII